MKFGLISLTALGLLALPALAMAQTTANTSGTALSGSESILAPTTNEYSSGTQTIHDNTQAPDVVVSGANQCALPIGASTSILGVGVGLAATPVDAGCERRNDANALLALGLRPASIALMCQDKNVQKAMKTAGTPCDQVGKLSQPVDPKPVIKLVQANPMAIQRANFCATLDPRIKGDKPYILECMEH